MNPKNELPRAVPILVVVLLCAWFVFVVVCFSDAGIHIVPATALIYGSLFWGVIWLVRLVATVIRRKRGTAPRRTVRYDLVHWGVEPVVLLLCGVLALTGGLYHVRFRLCRSSLDAYVADVIAGRVQPQGDDSPKRWVGLFHVAETELQAHGVVRIITTSTFFDDAGFAYSPVSLPPYIDEDSYDHITGPWYRWYRSW